MENVLVTIALILAGAFVAYGFCLALFGGKKFVDVDIAARERDRAEMAELAEQLNNLSRDRIARKTQSEFAQFVKDFSAHCKANRCYPESDFAIVEFNGSYYVGHSTDQTITDELWAILGVYPSREDAYSLILDLYIPF
jgi:hypothetical protein